MIHDSQAFGRLIALFSIDHVEKFFAVEIAAKVLAKYTRGAQHVIFHITGNMGA